MEIKVEKIYKSFGGITVLDDISFSLEKGQKVGLIGNNGTGKTTLLKILAGIIEPDAGEVIVRKDLTIGYMPQDTSIVSNETIPDYLRRVSGIGVLEEKLEQSPEALAAYEHRDGYSFDQRLSLTLSGFGLSDVLDGRFINSLSSGQKSKVFVSGVLLSDPELLLLDEPTNNFDLPALIWLEDFIARSDLASIIVSHDRLFLDRIVAKIFEIDLQTRTFNITSGRYSDYLVRKEKERARKLTEYETQQEEIKQLTDTVRAKKSDAARGSRFRGTDNDKFLRGFKRDRASKSGKAAKAIEKRIDQMEIVDKPFERDLFRIRIEPIKLEGSRDISLENVMAGYQKGFRIGPINLTIAFGERIVILGPNGSGKSTILKTVGGELKPLSGKMNVGNALVVGNLMQEHDDLPREERIKDFLMKRAGVTINEAYAMAVYSGFKPEEIDKEIYALSPGGRARLLFAIFSALSVNVLLLDEPTNHLDLEALEALEEAVLHYKGTTVVVSHDRYFLQKIPDARIWEISDSMLIKQDSFEEYLTKAEQESRRLIRIQKG